MAQANKYRRNYLRLNAYHLAKYRLIQKTGDKPIIAAVKNIGGGGICLQIEEYLPISSIIQLYINFPKLSRPIPTLAKVVWIRKVGNRNMYEAGIEFVDIEQIFRNAIVKSVDAVQRVTK